MDGRYFIEDYVHSYAARHAPSLKVVIRRVGHATAARMKPVGDGLAFWYEPNTLTVGRGRFRRHYSALTQATYARAFALAGHAIRDPALLAVADACFRSLLVPEPDGVLQVDGSDVYLAEVPMRPRDFVLNGWLTTLAAIHEYARLQVTAQATELVASSADFLRRVIDKFDAPGIASSRYSLTDPVQARIELEPRAGERVIQSFTLTLPHEGTFPIGIGPADRWSSHVDSAYLITHSEPIRPARGVLVANLVLSRIAFPEPPILELIISGVPVERVRLSLFLGQYSPQHATPVDSSWRQIAQGVPDAEGRVSLRLPWKHLALVGYPTNFGKRVGDKLVNSFHPLHVERLRDLGDRIGAPDLRAWADRWEQAMRTWPTMEMYAGRHVLLGSTTVPVEDLGERLTSR